MTDKEADFCLKSIPQNKKIKFKKTGINMANKKPHQAACACTFTDMHTDFEKYISDTVYIHISKTPVPETQSASV